MIWTCATSLLAARHGDDMSGLIGIVILILLSVIGTIINKIREKGQGQSDKKRPASKRPSEEPDRAGQPPRIRTEAGLPPRRRPPVRAIPPRVTPREQGFPGPPAPVSRRPVPQPPRRVGPGDGGREGFPSQSRPGPAGRFPPQLEPVRQARAPERIASTGLGADAARAAAQIALHAEKDIAERAERDVSRLAREERLRDTRLARGSAGGPAGAPAADLHATQLVRGPLSRSDLRKAVILAEILGPPVSER
jgi:hypothetical protein